MPKIRRRQRGGVVDAVADHGDLRIPDSVFAIARFCSSRIDLAPFRGLARRRGRRRCRPAARLPRRWLVVAGEQHRPQAQSCSSVDGGGRVGLHLVGEPIGAERLERAVRLLGDVDERLRWPGRRRAGWHAGAMPRASSSSLPTSSVVPSIVATTPRPGSLVNSSGSGDVEPALAGVRDDGLGQRVLAELLRRRREREHLVSVMPFERDDLAPRPACLA